MEKSLGSIIWEKNSLLCRLLLLPKVKPYVIDKQGNYKEIEDTLSLYYLKITRSMQKYKIKLIYMKIINKNNINLLLKNKDKYIEEYNINSNL